MPRKTTTHTPFDDDGFHKATHAVTEALRAGMGIPGALVSVETHANRRRPEEGCQIVLCIQASGIYASIAFDSGRAERIGVALVNAAARGQVVAAYLHAPELRQTPEPTETDSAPPTAPRPKRQRAKRASANTDGAGEQ